MSQSWGTARVTLPPDDDGMVGCQCPQEACRPRYFKIGPSSSSAAMASGVETTDAEVETEAQAAPEQNENADPVSNLEWLDASAAEDTNQIESEDEHDTEAQGAASAPNSERVLHCPYCGHTEDRQQFFTPEQWDYAKSLILRHITGMFQQQLKRLERRPDPHAFLSIGISVKPGALPAIATYEENRLKQRVVCPHCQAHYAVYGISFACPRCGGD